MSEMTLGTLCRRGHEHENTGKSLRRLKAKGDTVVVGDCLVCQKEGRKSRYHAEADEAKAAAMKWYVENKERAAQTSKRYYQKHRTEILAYQQKYREEHSEEIKIAKASYYQKNADRLKRKSRMKYYRNWATNIVLRKVWRKNHPEHVRLWDHRYSSSVRGQEMRRRNLMRYRLLKSTLEGSVSIEYKTSLLEALQWKCPHCQVQMSITKTRTKSSLTWDHVIPLSRGGQDDDCNLLPLCHSCNSSKGAKTVEEWLGRSVHTIEEMRQC